MDKLQLKAYGKINLALDVLRKREDGYHDLDMIMQMVDVYDDIIIEKNNNKDIVVKTDKAVLSNGKDNLAYMAAKTLMDEFGISQGVVITINKRTPIAGGMAGGSSDCATTMIGINQMFNLGLDKKALMERGVKLGADVPYCILGGTAIARGIGEVLTPLKTPPQCHVIIAKPPVSVSTAFVYGHIRPNQLKKHPDVEKMVEAINNQDLKMLASLLSNVMEEVTIPEYPIIQDIKEVMLENGALNSIMSGSGPTAFGLYDDKESAEKTVELLKEKKLTEQLYLTKFI